MAYELGALIDSTRTITVHSAKHRGSDPGALSAILLTANAAADARRVRAFQEMATAFQHLRHAGVLAVEDLVDHQGRPAAIAALPPGAPLTRLLGAGSRHGPFDLERAASVVLGAARAVQVLHAARPDLRPLGHLSADSLWITVEGRALLLPSARCSPPDAPSTLPSRPEWARYRAPECEHGSGDECADVYSLAVLLWDLLATGRPRSRKDDPDSTGKSPQWIQGAIVRLVMRSLSPEPSIRPRDPGAFAAELSRVAFGASSAARADAWPPPDDGEDPVTIELAQVRFSAPGRFCAVEPGVRSVEAPAECDPRERPPVVPRPRRLGALEPVAWKRPRPPSLPVALPAKLSIVCHGRDERRELRFADGPRKWIVGRAEGADLVVADPDMSRQHFEIRRDGQGRYLVHDLGSKNGLFVNGKAITDRRLEPGDELCAGATRLRFEA